MKLLLLAIAMTALAAEPPKLDDKLQKQLLVTQLKLQIAINAAAPYNAKVEALKAEGQPYLDSATKACGEGFQLDLGADQAVCKEKPPSQVPPPAIPPGKPPVGETIPKSPENTTEKK